MRLELLSYNVCHECQSERARGSAAKYGAHCAANRGKCQSNVLGVVAKRRRAFVALQEASEEFVRRAVRRLNATHAAARYAFLATPGHKRARAFLIYDAAIARLLSDTGGTPIVVHRSIAPGRPGLCALFSIQTKKGRRRSIVVHALHGPHQSEIAPARSYLRQHLRDTLGSLTAAAQRCKEIYNRNAFALPNIVMGDFNKDVRKPFSVECPRSLVTCRGDRPRRAPCPRFVALVDLVTCCIADPARKTRTPYRTSFDNILLSSGACHALKPARTQPPSVDRNLSSDHMPVSAAVIVAV